MPLPSHSMTSERCSWNSLYRCVGKSSGECTNTSARLGSFSTFIRVFVVSLVKRCAWKNLPFIDHIVETNTWRLIKLACVGMFICVKVWRVNIYFSVYWRFVAIWQLFVDVLCWSIVRLHWRFYSSQYTVKWNCARLLRQYTQNQNQNNQNHPKGPSNGLFTGQI